VIEIRGADELARVADDLRAAAASLPEEMSQGITKSMQPLPRAVKASALTTLPGSGGLAGLVARSLRITARQRSNGGRLQILSRFNLEKLDDGSVTHPTYGHRPLVTQSITPGFVSKPVNASEPSIRDAADKSLQRVADKVK